MNKAKIGVIGAGWWATEFHIPHLKKRDDVNKSTRPASSSELNSWKRGFTHQAEIWNGRMAIAGLGIILTILLASNILFSG